MIQQEKPAMDLDSVLQLLEDDVGEISRLVHASDSPDALKDAISGVLERTSSKKVTSSSIPSISNAQNSNHAILLCSLPTLFVF